MKKTIISNSAQTEIEKRINGELTAEYMYRALANSMQFIGYYGAQKFFLRESEQEAKHYQKLIDFCNDVGFLPELIMVLYLQKKINTIQDAFQAAYDKERELQIIYEKLSTQFINEPTVFQRLQFFVKEQKRSVGEYGDYLARLDICKNDIGAILQFDSELNN